MKKAVIVVLLLGMVFFTNGCLSQKANTHLHDKVDLVRSQTKILVEENVDEVTLMILKKLNAILLDKGITIPEELKPLIIAEAQNLAREYSMKGVDVGFDELHKLIDNLLPVVPGG